MQMTTLSLYKLRDGVVLDLGCGDGRYALKFAELGHRVVAVDKNLPIERHEHSLISYIEADAREFEITKGAFDLVFVRNVLPFLEDKDCVRKVLRSCIDGLAENGFIDFTLFGIEDGWFGREGILFFTEEELPCLNLKRICFIETIEDLPQMNGDLKLWHVYRFVYQKT